MLEYRLDDLHWAEFEKLCQGLLKANLGVGVESWGGSGDWGNDAYCQAPLRYPGTEVENGPFQFQAKFVQGANAAGSKPKALLTAAVKRECERITRRSQPIPRVYSLLTNVVVSPELRQSIEGMIKSAVRGCALVVVHGGDDICSWLHLQQDVARMFPQLLSHRDLAEVLRRSFQQETDHAKAPPPTPELSTALREVKKAAVVTSRRHDVDSALALWTDVQKQAETEGNKVEELGAKLERVRILLQDDRNSEEVLGLADACLQDAKALEHGGDQCRLLQIVGEVHRIRGNSDQARGFLSKALEHARRTASHTDEGYALLALSAVEESRTKHGETSRVLEMIDLAFNAFSSLYSDGHIDTQESAREGFAQCHSWRAKVFEVARPDDALAEWTRAIEIFQSIGDGREWDCADALVHRAELRARIGEQQQAATDLAEAVTLFQKIDNTLGMARCCMQAGELLDSMGKRDTAAEPFQQAAAIAATWNNDRKASYFYFRHACKLIELKKYDEAELILGGLADAPWLEPEIKLTVISQLCMVAHAVGPHDVLKQRCTTALALIDTLIASTSSAEKRRGLLIQKGSLLEQFGEHDEALSCFHAAIKRFEAIRDDVGVAECWFQIRGVMHALGDCKREREASEKVLALGGDKLSTVFISLTLVGLAQLNIREQRFSEAREQLDRAEQIAPDNPAVVMVANDLRNQLPTFSPRSVKEDKRLHEPSEATLSSLVHELRDWCAHFPAKRNAILPVWYYIHRTGLAGTIRSMLGVKFLIRSADATTFGRMKNALSTHGDLFIWGTNFGSKKKRTAEVVPVPKGFTYPKGVTVVTPAGEAASAGKRSNVDASPLVLEPISGKLDEAYVLAYLKGVDGFSDGSPFFAGLKCRFDAKVARFMLAEADPIGERRICLPLTEHHVWPNLNRTMQLAWENSAIPAFWLKLPQDEGTSCVCDGMLDLPADSDGSDFDFKEAWAQLLMETTSPSTALSSFTKKMVKLNNTERTIRRILVRVYMLRFEARGQQVMHPAVVVLSA